MSEQIQCICKPDCKCLANPNYAWASKMQSRRLELTKQREQKKATESKKHDQDLIDAIQSCLVHAIAKEQTEIDLGDWFLYPDMKQTLREDYFISLNQVGDSSRYKFKFLV
jgi:hypothetical protein